MKHISQKEIVDANDWNIRLASEQHRICMWVQRKIANKLYNLNTIEGNGDTEESDRLIEQWDNVKKKKEIYKNMYEAYLPETVQELMIAPFPFGVHFE